MGTTPAGRSVRATSEDPARRSVSGNDCRGRHEQMQADAICIRLSCPMRRPGHGRARREDLIGTTNGAIEPAPTNLDSTGRSRHGSSGAGHTTCTDQLDRTTCDSSPLTTTRHLALARVGLAVIQARGCFRLSTHQGGAHEHGQGAGIAARSASHPATRRGRRGSSSVSPGPIRGKTRSGQERPDSRTPRRDGRSDAGQRGQLPQP